MRSPLYIDLFYNNEFFFVNTNDIFVTNIKFVLIRHWNHCQKKFVIDVAINDKYIYLSEYRNCFLYKVSSCDLKGKNKTFL